MPGPLTGIRIIELAGIGPSPFAGMILADHGAEVIRVDRPSAASDPTDALLRSRSNLALDLKNPDDKARLLELVETADALIEGYRPGTLERLGLGPDVLLARNPRLVVGRMTGWGQTGPYSHAAGHDINYIALTGALHAIGPKERPVPPLALVGDFGGGGMVLALSVIAALLHAKLNGEGQVIDCAMCDGAGMLMTPIYSLLASGFWKDQRESNIADGAAHFFNAYETADAKFISIASIEPQFYALLLDRLGLSEDPDFQDQHNRAKWPALRQRLAEIFRGRTRDEWDSVFEATDVCYAPVLSLTEAPQHAMARERGSFVTVNGVLQPAPSPRYSATPLDHPRPSTRFTG